MCAIFWISIAYYAFYTWIYSNHSTTSCTLLLGNEMSQSKHIWSNIQTHSCDECRWISDDKFHTFWGLIYVSMMPCAEVVFNNMSQQMAGKGTHRGCNRSFKHGHQFTNSICSQPPITAECVCAHMTVWEREREECASCVLNVEDSLRTAL